VVDASLFSFGHCGCSSCTGQLRRYYQNQCKNTAANPNMRAVLLLPSFSNCSIVYCWSNLVKPPTMSFAGFNVRHG
jgi:hypothetical protein